jgi:hypothetical protein
LFALLLRLFRFRSLDGRLYGVISSFQPCLCRGFARCSFGVARSGFSFKPFLSGLKARP